MSNLRAGRIEVSKPRGTESRIVYDREPTIPELLAALSESLDVVCRECRGSGRLPAQPCKSHGIVHTMTTHGDWACVGFSKASEPCSSCRGGGAVPTDEAVEAVAKAFYEADDTYTEEWEFQAEDVKDWYRDKATAGLRAFLSGGWTEGSDG